ncbi:MAG: septation protein SepH [Ancrocorticia sp.]|jgi:hypothetical protein|nr:septation protein SepH [Ancrocorticia sp.]MCI1895634.1 septation protein SepH [Ancrocorticia sp.]MCI1932371.1 septation protein SepH [Ancrocorticia sp.]MCI1962970.1 septation protein SepH [Ancrocorticia sp.]MCI2001338.1 septation protein SepH [Ancrocorticia sp.]
MKKLELLGLQPDGENLTLTDEEGNRYSLPISEELRGALRRDRGASSAPQEARQMTPREIQAHIRAGKSVEEVSDMAALPAAKVEALAHPILLEREYTAESARSYPIGHEVGALTVEEVVASRLVSRGVNADDITWDAIREPGAPWTLIATFSSGNKERHATWHVNTEHRTLDAVDDEAAWLSEEQVPVPTSPWRQPNTPRVATETPVAPSSTRIDDVLASLDAQRGKVRPMPSDDEPDVPAGTSASAGTPASSADEASHPAEESDASVSPLFSVPEPPPQPEKKRRTDRPQMPSWDEIVFGKRD